ncbi:adenosylmethionine--8-amino-7-oxononanoate transaminase [bacterium]|nr:MAG: adenosylmethionine--8-amino-7-oxononanoate transaminase [bacterium]
MDDRKKTERLQRLDKKNLWHPFTQMKQWEAMEPLVIERGEGSFLIDTQGRRYLDGVSSLWVNVHGHAKIEINKAIIAQLGKISHSTLLGLGNVPAIELADKLVKIAPKGLKKVFYSDNGSTAVEIALKMAFQYCAQIGMSKKKKFIAFTGAYHGDTFGSMSVGEIDVFVKKYRPLLFKTFHAPYPYCYRCPVKKIASNCKTECLDVFEGLLKKHKAEIAACIIEPLIQGASGMITSPPGFLKEVRRLTKKYGVLLIADEVATGFGRTGAMFACEKEGVTPDFLCMAKGLTGGYLPLAATLTTRKVYNAFLGRHDEYKAFFHGHTYTGNQLGCVAALANISLFEKKGFFKKLEKKIGLFAALLDKFKGLPRVGDVRQAGLMAGIELVKDKKTKEPFRVQEMTAKRICDAARGLGLIIRPLGDTIVIMPPLSVKEAELKRICAIVTKCVKDITERSVN